MKEYELISTRQNIVTLGKVKCGSIEEAKLFLAMNFKEDFFGANIKSEDGTEIAWIAIKEAYDDPDPVKIALKDMDMKVKIRNGLCDIEEDDGGTTYTPYKEIVSIDGKLIKKR